jgi:precorrin-8X/cobalt-precorrin-8 methylmutase
MARRFEHYVIVDWSAANRPKTGRDSIWICHRGPDGERVDNPPTRHEAKRLLGEILAAIAARGERALFGFDFPFGYPKGFAARLGLGGPPWRAVWDEIAAGLADGEDNRNDRFALGAQFNRRISGGRFPFWGCPAGAAGEFLGPRHHNGHAGDGLAEKRLIDRWMVGAQPCWKLAYTGSVGGQALTGIPVVRALRDDARWAGMARVWPFETGLMLPEEAAIVFAEVWPSWWRARAEYGPPNDRAQVCTVAEILAARDAAGELAPWFAGDPGLTSEQRHSVESEEAWTLGVTAPRRPAKISSSPAPSRPLPNPPPPAGEGRVGVTRPLPNPPPPAGEGRVGVTRPLADPPPLSGREGVSAGECYSYLRDPAAIYRESFARIRAEADLARFPAALRSLALRLAHAAGEVGVLGDLAWSRGAAQAGRRALISGRPILADSEMTAAGIAPARLPAANRVICTLRDPAVAALAAARQTTRSAAAVELWRPHLKDAVVAIGNAPTALFHLLEMLQEGADRPALILAFPVGFVGAAEAKEALIGFGRGPAYVTLRGRRGGSALAAAAVNALSGRAER